MSEPKTKATTASVNEFVNSIEDIRKRDDSFRLIDIFKRVTGNDPVMWGSSIIGFGKYHYKSERSSQEGDWMLTGFSPRKQNLALYLLIGIDKYDALLEQLGKHTIGKSCLYIKLLEDVDLKILEELIEKTYQDMRTIYADN